MSIRMLSAMAGVAVIAGLAVSADAEPLAYQGFDGNATGFTAPGYNGPGGNAGTEVPGLSYGPLSTSGFARQGGQAWANRGVLPQEINSGTVWMSWLYQTGSTPSTWNRLITAINGDIIGTNERYNLGYLDSGFAARGVFGSGAAPTVIWPATPVADTTYMLVAKYDFGAAGADNGTISLWVNPNVASLGTDLAPAGNPRSSLPGLPTTRCGSTRSASMPMQMAATLPRLTSCVSAIAGRAYRRSFLSPLRWASWRDRCCWHCGDAGRRWLLLLTDTTENKTYRLTSRGAVLASEAESRGPAPVPLTGNGVRIVSAQATSVGGKECTITVRLHRRVSRAC